MSGERIRTMHVGGDARHEVADERAMKKIRRTAGKGGRDPGVNALRGSIHRSAINAGRSARDRWPPLSSGGRYSPRVEDVEGCAL